MVQEYNISDHNTDSEFKSSLEDDITGRGYYKASGNILQYNLDSEKRN